MTKELIKDEIEKYGKWASNKIDKPLYHVYIPIKNQDDIDHKRNAMATGNYPLGMSDCEVVGINGDCGPNCPVYLRGECTSNWGDE